METKKENVLVVKEGNLVDEVAAAFPSSSSSVDDALRYCHISPELFKNKFIF